MNEAIEFLARYGALILLANVFVEQLGLPIPALPMMLAAGALSRLGRMNLAEAVALSTVGSLAADLIWFYLGRVRGNNILGLLCRISLEPDTCVRRTSYVFTRLGMRAVITGKFVPGLSTLMPPLAGMSGVSTQRFVAYDGFGSFLYSIFFLSLGYLFGDQLQLIIDLVGRFGRGALWLVGGFFGAYIAYKYIQQKLVVRQLRMARITPQELHNKQEAGEKIAVVDLRSEADMRNDPYIIPGAWHFYAHELEVRHEEIPRDRDVVVYCSCPNEGTAAHIAMLLRKRGVTRVRPLLGGLKGWRENKYPLDPHVMAAQKDAGTP